MTTSLQEKKIERIAEKVAIRVFKQAFSDPDFGLELWPEFERRLKKSIVSRKLGRLRSLKEVVGL